MKTCWALHAGFGDPAPRGPLTCGREQQRAVLAVQILHGGDPGVPRVAVVEVIQLLPLFPVPETSGKERGRLVVRETQTKCTGQLSPTRQGGHDQSHKSHKLSQGVDKQPVRTAAGGQHGVGTRAPRGQGSPCWPCTERSAHPCSQPPVGE